MYVGGDLGGGLFAELDVPAEAAQVQMPGFGLEFGGGASVGGQSCAGRGRRWPAWPLRSIGTGISGCGGGPGPGSVTRLGYAVGHRADAEHVAGLPELARLAGLVVLAAGVPRPARLQGRSC